MSGPESVLIAKLHEFCCCGPVLARLAWERETQGSDVCQVSALLVNRLGKPLIAPWPAALAGAQGQGMGASSGSKAKCS